MKFLSQGSPDVSCAGVIFYFRPSSGFGRAEDYTTDDVGSGWRLA